MCNDCHLDRKAMQEVEREESLAGEAKPSDDHFVHASDSYEMTLHGRLVQEDNAHGVSCNQCHAPEGYHHGILPTEHPESAVNPEQLPELCGSSGCHSYVDNQLNQNFLLDDMHDLDWVPGHFMRIEAGEFPQLSQWGGVLLFMLPVVFLFSAVGLVLSIVQWRRDDALPILGGKRFERIFLARKKRPKKKDEKTTDQVAKRKLFGMGRRREWIRRFKRSQQQQNREE
jgi:sulfite reductase (NADPH) flavoprotein alpha-component